jgi:hypothetical protein
VKDAAPLTRSRDQPIVDNLVAFCSSGLQARTPEFSIRKLHCRMPV